ncbi:MAG: glucose 1-dehydrogenase [Actinobacteria bacterium]|nr:glucose 1-dehydrogenase [Actinomycetota bacterium]
MFDLSGKVAIVTGGSRGIGLGIANAFAGAGAAIVVAATNPEQSVAAVTQLQAGGARAAWVPTDVSDPDAVQAMVDQTVRLFGRIDILVNNAGINIRKRPEDLTPEEWHQVLAVNLDGPFLCSRAAYAVMKAGGGGKIINIGSLMSIFGNAKASAYGASKGGVVQLTKALAIAWAADGIQVNAILPGWIDTDLTQGARQQSPGLEEVVQTRTPEGRWGMPSDLGGPAVFLASAASDFVTGTTLIVDGGFAAD